MIPTDAVPAPRVGDRRVAEALGIVVECHGVTEDGWAKVRAIDARYAYAGQVCPRLWAEYAPAEGGERG